MKLIWRQMRLLPIDHTEVKFPQILDLPGNRAWALSQEIVVSERYAAVGMPDRNLIILA